MASLKKKVIVTCVCITAAAAAIAMIPAEKNVIVRGVKSLFTPGISAVSGGAHSFNSLKSFFAEMNGYREENQRLIQEISTLRQQTKAAGDYMQENERLMNLLELKNNMDDFYHSVPARVISYEPNNWYDTIMINKGTYHGIHPGDAVISNSGIVGKVVEAGTNWAEIASVLNQDNAIGVRIIRNGNLAIVEGDETLAKEKSCKLTFIDKNTSVTEGDALETSGSGGVYPEGQIVGVVKELKSDNAGANFYAVVEPAVDFANLYEVIVLGQKE